ncbi:MULTISPECIES: S8 family serine peptidase [Tenacibaculum]|uniref:S8 family serine peptidase n=1 Tax=Tenacibaculum TaxID=104267 RepID=UPI00089CB086|nr:S8 family serine peptidase [Tenacibaculum sp. MAR_2010_89]SEE57503.1 Por secretion system C-terminal sorting domain-containing protein [Tenacibaculum sp. MAR_2010_89]
MKKLLLFCVLLFSSYLFSQEDAWVILKDKPSASNYLSNPLTMLSQRSLDRRTKQKIALDEKDVPVHSSYYNQIKGADGITVLAKSKWLNAIHIRGEKSKIDALKTTFNFIDKIEFANRSLNARTTVSTKKVKASHYNKFSSVKEDFNYGLTSSQITMIKADFLHKKGFTGKGMQIAVIDAGFPNVNILSAFKRIRDNNKILGGYDFVNRSTNFYSGHNHGTNVLSDISGYIKDQFVGTAPDASFYLFITEDVSNEGPLEESLWVEAAERSDSLGVDVINTSLGYTTFDNANYSHTYADMDGKTAFISRGAEIGVSRGMILVTSAGNDGNKSWKYISAPADAASVFTIGAVDATETIASFSSFGPTADGRVKPDVLAHGRNVYVINHQTGIPSTSNGTSFSSPVMAGAVASFWQAFPSKTNVEIMNMIRESADKYSNPTNQYGYGVPDLEQAYNKTLSSEDNDKEEFKIFPNPVKDHLIISFTDTINEVIVYSVLGQEVYKNISNSNIINVSSLNKGVYILQIKSGRKIEKIKFIKK